MKKNKRINFCDIIILIALLAVVCGLTFRKPVENLVESLFFKSDVVYTADVYNNDNFDLSQLSEGTELYNEADEYVGTIIRIKQDFIPQITINTSGLSDRTGTYIGKNMFIAPGLNIELHTQNSGSFICLVKKVQTN